MPDINEVLRQITQAVNSSAQRDAPAARVTRLFITEQEAQALRDLRALKGVDDRQRKHLKAMVFTCVKERLGIAADRKIAVEIDDRFGEDYLVVKYRNAATENPLPTPVRRWYRVMVHNSGEPSDAAEIARHLAQEFEVMHDTDPDFDHDVRERIAVINDKVYVSLYDDEI